jgi:integrase
LQTILANAERIMDYKPVSVFLSSMLRNSLKSTYAYQYGLTHFQKYLTQRHPQYNIENILNALSSKSELDVYVLLDGFVSYLADATLKLTSGSIKLYLAAVRSYLAYYDVDIIPSKFKRKVKVPKLYREDEEPLDASDIRKILLSCNNRRLKTYLLALASGGMRATECLAIRLKDVDFSVSPTKIHIRKEYAKTRVARDIYISDEATQYLKQWMDWKYNNEERPRIRNDEDLIFTVYRTANPVTLYIKVLKEFEKLLSVVGLDARKEGKQRRRKITLHSLRRFVKTVISDQTSTDYSEWFLGHNKSPYYTKKEPQRREIYATKCMKYLTFLDYSTLETTGKNIEAKLSERDKQIETLIKKQEHFEQLVQSLIDSGQLQPTTNV